MRLIFPAAIALALVLAGCDNSSSPDGATRDEALVGSWSLSDSQSRADGDTSRIAFMGDGTFRATTHSVEQIGSSSYSSRSLRECSSIGNWSTAAGWLTAQFTMTCVVSSTTTSSQGTKDTSYQESGSETDTNGYSIRGSSLRLVSSYSNGGKVVYDTTTFAKVLASRKGL